MPDRPPAGPADDAEPVLDSFQIGDLRDALGDPMMLSLANDYLAGARRLLAVITDAAASAAERADAAHALKGSSLSLGLVRLARLCQAVEAALIAGRQAEAEALLAGLPERVAADQAALVAALSTAPGEGRT